MVRHVFARPRAAAAQLQPAAHLRGRGGPPVAGQPRGAAVPRGRPLPADARGGRARAGRLPHKAKGVADAALARSSAADAAKRRILRRCRHGSVCARHVAVREPVPLDEAASARARRALDVQRLAARGRAAGRRLLGSRPPHARRRAGATLAAAGRLRGDPGFARRRKRRIGGRGAPHLPAARRVGGAPRAAVRRRARKRSLAQADRRGALRCLLGRVVARGAGRGEPRDAARARDRPLARQVLPARGDRERKGGHQL
mmetsp:Transcript_47127/g.152183  ORF Transcript_47127/g.152183 Transcript_47127/m.152183 type:complete len:258 (-) Transcript_47127:108-881(-)